MVKLIKNTNRNYTNISNEEIRDGRLTWKARGIFSYLWSQADNWQFHVTELVNHAPDGKDSLQGGLKELEQYGYLKRVHAHTSKNGQFDGMTWILSDLAASGEIRKKEAKKAGLPSDGKSIGWENHRMGKRPLRNNNNKNYQYKELSNKRNKESGKKPDHTKADSNDIKTIVSYLNDKTGKHYLPTSNKTKELIHARMAEGFKVDDFKKVIDTKEADWGDDSKMAKYLRPETLFGTKFEGYLNEQTKQQMHGGFDDDMMMDLDDPGEPNTSDLPF